MSGVSLSRYDPCRSSPKTRRLLVMGSLRVSELQLVAFIMIFSASGLVPVFDLAFPVFTSGYLLLLSRLVFRPIGCSSSSSQKNDNICSDYVILGTTVGLFLPLAYVLGGFARGDEHSVESATPPLLLLSCQILTENIISGVGGFSPPVRALVPMLYTVRRIFVIFDWVQDVWIIKNSSHLSSSAAAEIKDVAWVWFGRGLAVANLSYFSINLFCFLIPRFLPEAFSQYLMKKINYDNEMKKQLHPPPDEQQQHKNST